MTTRDQKIGVLLIDDDLLIRSGVAAVITSASDIVVVGEAENGRRGIELAGRERPDVILLDIRMPVLDGLDTLTELLRLDPDARVVMLTTFGEEEYIDRALRLGASGFLLKSADPRELISAVRAVATGAAALSPRIARRVIDRVRTIDDAASSRAQAAIETLTARERDVLRLVGGGFSNAEIAGQLFLTEATVKGYMTSILFKLEAKNRVDVAILAYQAGIVDATRD